MSMFRNLLMQQRGWSGKPSDWADIRKDCPANSIALYAGHTADYSQYDNLGFTATCTGGYNVFIDGTQYGTTYASDAQCSITWSTSGITTGDSITTPSALKAHIIDIYPQNANENIIKFKCSRVAASGTEEQGVLWAHFNLTNAIGLDSLFFDDNYKNTLLTAVTAKDNRLNITSQWSWASGLYLAFCGCSLLEYLPTLNTRQETNVSYWKTFNNCKKLITVRLTQGRCSASSYEMFSSSGIKKIKGNFTVIPTENMFHNCQYLEELPNIDATNSTNCSNFLTNATSLKDTVLDMRAGTGLQAIGCYGNASHFMSGFKGLRVSNEAPFTGTAPQINVSYTGMDRQALVTLFNDLPYNVGYNVVGSPTINKGVISGFSENDYVATSETIQAQDISELVVKIRINSSALGKQQWQGILSSNFFINFYCGNNAFEYAQIYFNGIEGISFNTLLQPDTDYWLKYINNGTTATALYSTDGVNFIAGASKDPSLISTQSPGVVRYGTRGAQAFDGSIDFNNTYIKKNGVYWFRGQPAMTKTLSCVGATGTADLTAEDKDIALNKGWSLTLS